mmetsp:Transcript_124907/g.400091  ORF Transcript_124907/g.400091 Transcript_124907/m.400091 type:complete len:381 (-) Transcript_124907:501-1643(-)
MYVDAGQRDVLGQLLATLTEVVPQAKQQLACPIAEQRVLLRERPGNGDEVAERDALLSPQEVQAHARVGREVASQVVREVRGERQLLQGLQAVRDENHVVRAVRRHVPGDLQDLDFLARVHRRGGHAAEAPERALQGGGAGREGHGGDAELTEAPLDLRATRPLELLRRRRQWCLELGDRCRRRRRLLARGCRCKLLDRLGGWRHRRRRRLRHSRRNWTVLGDEEGAASSRFRHPSSAQGGLENGSDLVLVLAQQHLIHVQLVSAQVLDAPVADGDVHAVQGPPHGLSLLVKSLQGITPSPLAQPALQARGIEAGPLDFHVEAPALFQGSQCFVHPLLAVHFADPVPRLHLPGRVLAIPLRKDAARVDFADLEGPGINRR